MSYTPIPYPRRLYLRGLVIPGDLHATNSVVVEDAEAEEAAREKGYRKAYEEADLPTGGNVGSEAPALHPSDVAPTEDQGGVAAASADPLTVETKGYDDGTTATGTAPLPELSPEEQAAAELAALRAEAAALGLKPHHKAGAAKLREMIAAAKG